MKIILQGLSNPPALCEGLLGILGTGVVTTLPYFRNGPRQANLCLRAFRHDKF